MVVAKNPGIGQGKGGGRPKREDFADLRLRLSPRAAGLLQAHAEAAGLPLWRVVDDLVLAGLDDQAPPPAPELPRLAVELAQTAADFLARHENSRMASRALRRAWGNAVLIAEHDLTRNIEAL